MAICAYEHRRFELPVKIRIVCDGELPSPLCSYVQTLLVHSAEIWANNLPVPCALVCIQITSHAYSIALLLASILLGSGIGNATSLPALVARAKFTQQNVRAWLL